MITEDYASFETAKLLKEKGFSCDEISCIKVFKGHTYKIQGTVIDADEDVTIPTLQMAMKWLREEKKIGIEINTNFYHYDGNKWRYEYGFCIFQLSGSFEKFAECDYDGYKTYEQACESAIKYCLEKLI